MNEKVLIFNGLNGFHWWEQSGSAEGFRGATM